jgi:hypothetical protein
MLLSSIHFQFPFSLSPFLFMLSVVHLGIVRVLFFHRNFEKYHMEQNYINIYTFQLNYVGESVNRSQMEAKQL